MIGLSVAAAYRRCRDRRLDQLDILGGLSVALMIGFYFGII